MYEIGDKMERNIYKLFKELDDCEKRCLKKLIENEENEATDEQIKELMEWLKKDRYSADSLDPIVHTLNKQLDNVKVDFLFLREIKIENVHFKNPNDYSIVLIEVQEDDKEPEIYQIKTLLEKELEERRFLKDKKTVEQLIASTKEAYEEYYGKKGE